MKSHKDLEDYIENVYSFKKLWKKICSKYDINSQPHILPPAKRIIVLGDIHGDWDMMINALKIGKVIDNDHNWIGGETIVVQVGDQIDRCRYNGIPCNTKEATNPDEGNDWKILQYFTKLHHQAQKEGGAVYSLIGNHELMNVDGDFRYVSYEGLREFDNYKKPDGDIIKDGEEARRWAFKPGNPISEFMACTRQMALIIGSNLFAHAGVLPKIAKKYSVKNLNQLLTLYLLEKLDKPSSYNDAFKASDTSPMWNRIYGNMGNKSKQEKLDCSKYLKPLKKIYQVDKIFVGHTPQMKNGISNVCDEKIWLTDYGMSKAFDKFDGNSDSETNQRSISRKAQVLEILDDGKEINVLK
jgi:hypothetical protein